MENILQNHRRQKKVRPHPIAQNFYKRNNETSYLLKNLNIFSLHYVILIFTNNK